MKNPTILELDKIRKAGLRPQVVGCIINNGKILFVYKEKYNLWQFPQGGIDNRETTEEALLREMTEELGETFVKSFQPGEIIEEDTLIFSRKIQGTRNLQTDAGTSIFMLGKKYFFIVINTPTSILDITKTEFENYKWLDYQESLVLANNIYQKGKKQTILKALSALRTQNIL